jgi:serine/threonine protein kinase
MDIAARNVLLDDRSVVKIADFGLSQSLAPEESVFRIPPGAIMKLPILYQAPESMTAKIFSSKSDCWAFGITCWEIITLGGRPYGRVKYQDIKKHVMEGGRCPKPRAFSKQSGGTRSIFWDIMAKCWEPQPKDRPTFGSLIQSFNKLSKMEMKEGKTVRDVGNLIRCWGMPGPAGAAAIAECEADTVIWNSAPKVF